MLTNNGGGAGRSRRVRKILQREKLGEKRLHNLCQLEVWQVRRMPGSSSAREGEQCLGLEIRKAKKTQWFYVRGCSVELCYPLPARLWQCPAAGSSASLPTQLPPSILPASISKTSEYEGHLPVPACPAPAVSIHPEDRCSTCSPGSKDPCAPRQWYQQGWELCRLL